MLKYNNTDLFTGYLKQLLSSFDLPTYKIYTLKNAIDFKELGLEKEILVSTALREIPYIKDGALQIYLYDDQTKTYNWKTLVSGINSKLATMQNYTKRLIIKNNLYDSYTHNYLGDYLRYLRDVNNINLMPLYNCFSNEMPENLNLSIEIKTTDDQAADTAITTIKTATFNSTETNYKIYMLPVKFFNNYTIAIDSNTAVELFCGFYNTKLITDASGQTQLSNFMSNTYTKFNSCKFSVPSLYTNLCNTAVINMLNDISSNAKVNFYNLEKDLKLFIKVPYNNTSSITILEGEYQKYNDRQYIYNNNWTQQSNNVIINFENLKEHLAENPILFKPITHLQLLEANTRTSYPFADRLIEYLIGNAITSEEELEDNIKRLQKVLASNKIYSDNYGLWENIYQYILYTYGMKYINNSLFNHDILGYIDKDIENNYKSVDKNGNVWATLKNIDLYSELYNTSNIIESNLE